MKLLIEFWNMRGNKLNKISSPAQLEWEIWALKVTDRKYDTNKQIYQYHVFFFLPIINIGHNNSVEVIL